VNTIESLKVGRPWISALLTYAAFSRLTRSKGCGRLPAGDIDIYYKRFGCGEPVLLLHGGFMVSEGWAAQMPALARDHMVIAMDSRGHGRTTLGTAQLTYRQMGLDVANLIERLGVGPAHVIGSSDGGIAGLALALERPDLLRSLVLLGTSFLSPRAPVLLGLRGLRRLMNPEPWTGRRFVASMRKLWTTLPDFTVEELGTICTPTLVIGCDKDEFLSLSDDPLEVFRETAAAMPNAELAVIPGGTHTVNINRPGVVNELILNFIASV
jgi:pimeloyl-ACP methyl ester carboxylesterase